MTRFSRVADGVMVYLVVYCVFLLLYLVFKIILLCGFIDSCQEPRFHSPFTIYFPFRQLVSLDCPGSAGIRYAFGLPFLLHLLRTLLCVSNPLLPLRRL